MSERRKEKRYRVSAPVYAKVFPGDHAARLFDCSPSGMGLVYKNGKTPDVIREIFILVQGYVHQLHEGEFELVHHRAIRGGTNKATRFRKAGIRLTDPSQVSIFPLLKLYALEASREEHRLQLHPQGKERIRDLFSRSVHPSGGENNR